MTRLIHLTDLHFGLERDDLTGPLREAILSCRPDAIVVSGDLTQRALRAQFASAMRFLHGLGAPFLVVPGNHDVPLFNPFARLLTPFAPFREGAGRDLTPTLEVGRLRILSANTADPWQWRGGLARTAEIARVCRVAEAGTPDVTNILVCHHPLVDPPGFQRGETRNAEAAMARLADAGVRIVLSGHLHHWTTGLGITEQTPGRVFLMQTGTALCARAGERDHGFAVLDIDGERLSVTPWMVTEARAQFEQRPGMRYVHRDEGWYRTEGWRADG